MGSLLRSLNAKEVYVLLCLPAMGQEHVLTLMPKGGLIHWPWIGLGLLALLPLGLDVVAAVHCQHLFYKAGMPVPLAEPRPAPCRMMRVHCVAACRLRCGGCAGAAEQRAEPSGGVL